MTTTCREPKCHAVYSSDCMSNEEIISKSRPKHLTPNMNFETISLPAECKRNRESFGSHEPQVLVPMSLIKALPCENGGSAVSFQWQPSRMRALADSSNRSSSCVVEEI
jgi:hypothetical protein